MQLEPLDILSIGMVVLCIAVLLMGVIIYNQDKNLDDILKEAKERCPQQEKKYTPLFNVTIDYGKET